MDERLKHKLLAAREHFERREYEHAEPLLLQVIEKIDRFADVFNMLGLARHDRGDFRGAREAFERAVELNPRYTEALLNLVVVCNDLGDYDEARRVHESVGATTQPGIEGGRQDPYALGKIANLHAEVAVAYADAGFLDEAIAELGKAVRLRPSFADLHLKLGALLRDRGNLEAARQAYDAALVANPNYAEAHVQMGVTLFSMGQPKDALARFEHALELDPDHRIAAMYRRLVDKPAAP